MRAAHLANVKQASSSAFAHSISLDLFTAHSTPTMEGDVEYWTYPCRCSSQFRVTLEELEKGVEVVGCEGCSERCRVEYEVVEEEEG